MLFIVFPIMIVVQNKSHKVKVVIAGRAGLEQLCL